MSAPKRPRPVSLTTPSSGKVTKPKGAAKRETCRDSFKVEGPMTVVADFARYEIGAGDKICFRTRPAGEIIIEHTSPTLIRVVTRKKRLVADRLGKNSFKFLG